MDRKWTLALSGLQYERLQAHLHPGDGLEAAAILLCRVVTGDRSRLLVHDYILAPLTSSARERDHVIWSGEVLSGAIDRAEDEGASLVLIHSHPGSMLAFSSIDDVSDRDIIPHIFAGWSEQSPARFHGSAIMTPDGAIRARFYDAEHNEKMVDLVTVVGDDIKYFWVEDIEGSNPPAVVQPFCDGMTDKLGRLSVCIIGASGTGSIMAEQAARMGFGEINLIDFDLVEHKNLNRILNSSIADAQKSRLKVNMLKAAIESYRDNCAVNAYPLNISEREAVLAASKSDVLFGCVDSLEGRYMLDLLAQAMLLPLFDVGVTIPTWVSTDGRVVISDAFGRIDYIQPGRSTLFTREVYNSESLRAEYLAAADPDAFRDEAAEGYIKGIAQEAPSVIALNMQAASASMLEYIARAFPFRHESNANYARTIFSIASAEHDHFAENSFSTEEHPLFATGLREPLLGIPSLSE
tara:strand:+ start:3860 stop:5257 length:1398 start_codon:yes stop_codon:yes gene_type:complete